MEDIFKEAREKIGEGLIRSMFQSDGSYTDKREYFILSPLRSDRHVGSFSINLDTGLWCDRASEGDEGDFIDLVARYRGVSLIDAAREICGKTQTIYVQKSREEREKEKKQLEEKLPRPIIPIPENALEELKGFVSWHGFIELWGTPSKVFRYFDYDGNFIFVVVRYEKPLEEGQTKRAKNDILMYYGDGNKWKAKRHPSFTPYAPYGAENLKNSALPILIVEGEKCKNEAQKALEGKYIVISWLGGTKNIQNTDWGALKPLLTDGRKIYFWPDADSQRDKTEYQNLIHKDLQPGYSAALYVKSIIPQLLILEIYRAFPIESDPAGYDVADYIKDGNDPAQFIIDFTPYKDVQTNIDPFQVYRAFIDYHFDYDNLEQFAGWYWEFDTTKKYWIRAEQKDLACNLQRWLEETGIQFLITKSGQEATTFINKVLQYLARHSVGYIADNPLKEASVSEFVHFKNGAVRFTKHGSEWYGRDKYSEDFFKKLYPVSCLEVPVDYGKYRKLNPKKDIPAFYFFVKEMIPRSILSALPENEKENVINETIMYFAQILAYTISAVKVNEYFFGLKGQQRTGKSFFMKIVKNLVGEQFCSERPVKNMEQSQFATAGLVGKKVYIEPDLKTRQPLPEDFIKAYAGEQVTTIEAKNKDPIDGVKISIAMFFLSNYEFTVHGADGIERRMVMIPFYNKIETHDVMLLDKICGEFPHGKESPGSDGDIFDERTGILSLSLQGWDEYIKNGFLIKAPAWINTDKERWQVDVSPVAAFLKDAIFSREPFYSVDRSVLYSDYKDWCKDEGRKELGKKNFLEEIRKIETLKEQRVNNGFTIMYVPKEEKQIEEKPEPVIAPAEKVYYQDEIPF